MSLALLRLILHEAEGDSSNASAQRAMGYFHASSYMSPLPVIMGQEQPGDLDVGSIAQDIRHPRDWQVSVLRDLEVQPYYRSDRHRLLQDFYEPCLAQARHYDRAAGYFTSAT